MKKYLVTGFIILMPAALTFVIIVFLINILTTPFLGFVTHLLANLQQTLPKEIVTLIARILILIVLIIGIFVLGVITRWFFFGTLINWTNYIFSKIPFIKTVYKVTRDMIAAFFTEKERKAFKKPIAVPFPHEKSYCVSFLTGEIPTECKEKLKKKYVSVLVPTAPHPISGYILMVPQELAKKIDMSNEEAIKFTVSCGVIMPKLRKKKIESSK